MWKKIGLAVIALVFVLCPFSAQGAEKQFNLVFEYHGPSTHSRAGNKAPMVGGWMDAVEKRSGGRIKFERHWGGEPVPVKEALDALKRGSLDIITEVPHFYSGKIAIADIGIMPKNYRTFSDIFDLWWNSPLGTIIDTVYQKRVNAKVLFPLIFAAENMQISKRTAKIRKFEDLKGLKIRAAGGLAHLSVKCIGGAPVSTIGGEYYTAMQRGTIDAGIMTTYSLESYKMWEVCHQVVNPPIFNRCHQLWWINLDKWNELGPELQDILIGTSRMMEVRFISHINVDDARIEKLARERGVEFYTLPDEEADKMWKAVEPVWDEYVKKCAKQGLESEAKQVRAILNERFKAQ
jgi:TRAP-type C4-dicarboxylate transport system substrate-binding protein